ncbi:hypothetical protein LXL04_007511 [Taraxacum kok-saghyz]
MKQSQHQRNYLKSDCEGRGRARSVAGEGAVAGGCSTDVGIDLQEAEARVDLQEAVVDLRRSPASPCTKNHASSYKCFVASLPGTHSFTKNKVKVDTAAYMKKVPKVKFLNVEKKLGRKEIKKRQLTLENEIASHPSMLGTAAIIKDCTYKLHHNQFTPLMRNMDEDYMIPD